MTTETSEDERQVERAMFVQTFKAATMAEVLVRMSEALGPDAVILDTRTTHRRGWLGWGRLRLEAVEVTAARTAESRTTTPPPAVVEESVEAGETH